MTHRWIIRGFFMGLLAISVSAWTGSHSLRLLVGYNGTSLCCWCDILKGHLSISGQDAIYAPAGLEKGWSVNLSPPDPGPIYWTGWQGQHSLLGFAFGRVNIDFGAQVGGFIAIPLWFPTAVIAALLWLVWRKTRATPDPKTAFPVEATPGEGHKERAT